MAELKAMFFEWPVFDVSGWDGVLLDGRFYPAAVLVLPACVFKLWAFFVSMFLRLMFALVLIEPFPLPKMAK